MLFTSPGQYLVLLILLVAGWLLGLASHPGGRKWKARYYAERDARAEERRDREARIKQLEGENAELARRPTVADPAASAAPVASAAAVPAYRRRPSRGWFNWGSHDDLTRIRGIDRPIADRLTAETYGSFSALAAMRGEDEASLEQRLGLPAGRIARDRWREQAALLSSGDEDGWRQRYG